MKRDLIYLTLLAALFAAAKVMAQSDGTSSRQGLTPRTIEVGFTKTVHILFPAPVTYIDIGSMAIIAGKADGAENVVRVKAAVRDFAEETNLTVITEDGGFYTFDARYAENPSTSTIEIAAAESPATQPASASEPARADEGRVLLREVGRERPATVKRVLSDIYRQNRAVNHKTQIRKQSVYIFFLQSETAIIQSPNRQKQRQEPQHCHRFPSLSAFQISGSENPPCQEQRCCPQADREDSVF